MDGVSILREKLWFRKAFKEILCNQKELLYLGDFDSRWRSWKSRLAGLKLTDWTEVTQTTAVQSSKPKSVCQPRSQFLLLTVCKTMRTRQLPL